MFWSDFDSSNLLNLITSPTNTGLLTEADISEAEVSDDENIQIDTTEPRLFDFPIIHNEWIENLSSIRKADRMNAIENIKAGQKVQKWNSLQEITCELRDTLGGSTVSTKTVRRRLGDMGFSCRVAIKKPLVNEKNRRKRKSWYSPEINIPTGQCALSHLGKNSSLVRKQKDDHSAMAAPKSGLKSYRKRMANHEEANKHEASRSKKYPRVTGSLNGRMEQDSPREVEKSVIKLARTIKRCENVERVPNKVLRISLRRITLGDISST
ncbi:hypothetical protein LOD99_8542 [Oopsacas minuta]|uniref:Transposase Tc1-like domain-containing protein n=1 Tax=Oopsacas minuta TaxID=111878 RepID=A0AAV7JFX2_9METZ|nr:hypothetical protein LOD99_8542 [Oopsacas minuta]